MTNTELNTVLNNYKSVLKNVRELLTKEREIILPAGYKYIEDIKTENSSDTFRRWDDTISYVVDDLISYNSVIYRCIVDNVNEYPANDTRWTALTTYSKDTVEGEIDIDVGTFTLYSNKTTAVRNGNFIDIIFNEEVLNNYIVLFRKDNDVKVAYSLKTKNGFKLRVADTNNQITKSNNISFIVITEEG